MAGIARARLLQGACVRAWRAGGGTRCLALSSLSSMAITSAAAPKSKPCAEAWGRRGGALLRHFCGTREAAFGAKKKKVAFVWVLRGREGRAPREALKAPPFGDALWDLVGMWLRAAADARSGPSAVSGCKF